MSEQAAADPIPALQDADVCQRAARSCLAAIAAAHGEGARVFTQLYPSSALAEAAAADRRRLAGSVRSPIDGLIVAVKDLFDINGHTTWAGSRLLRDWPRAAADAVAVSGLRNAGAVIIGKTNMTEFAYSGLGLNPHFGTPANPHDRGGLRRIPGGSSSGAAVAVADAMAEIALGTDTGGSIRIPAALCGLVGWKPTAHRISLAGVWPLAPSFDSVGVIARSVQHCAMTDSVLTGSAADAVQIPAGRLRLGRLRGYLESELEPAVSRAYENALVRLTNTGIEIVDVEVPDLERVPREHPGVIMTTYEAFQTHSALLPQFRDLYDPRVRARLELGRAISAEQYAAARAVRMQLQHVVTQALQGFDAWVLPTVTKVAPTFQMLESDEGYVTSNRALLRNTSLINFLDGCAITLPCQTRGEVPVGLSIASLGVRDAAVLAIARRLEAIVASPD
jgi:aspartyl-tRNA(Asn)/glutamyl-tRNA(Gln) amidotransferase subunit A